MATLVQLRDRIRLRTDTEADDHITDAYLNTQINAKYQELYELLVLNGLHRSENSLAIVADGSANYALPADMYAILAVFRLDDAGRAHYLTRHDHRVYPDVTVPAPGNTYRVVGPNIEFNPVPADGDYVVKYIPVPGTLVNDADTVDGVLGWEEYVVVAASISVAYRGGDDVEDISVLKDDLRELRNRIKVAAGNAEMSETAHVAKVRPSAFDGYALPGDFETRGVRWWP